MNKFNFCILADDFPTKDRQVFIFVEQLVIALADLGHKVSVVAPQSITRSIIRRIPLMPPKEDIKTVNGFTYTVYRPYSISVGNSRFGSSLFRAFNQTNINKVLKQIQPNILYGHFWHNAYKLKDYSLCTNTPLFVACGEGDDALEKLVNTLTVDDKTKLMTAVKGVISVSSENKRRSINLGICRENDVIILPNCVDDSLFHPMDSSYFRNQLGISDNDFTIAFTGAFIKRKGSQILAEAINKLNDDTIKVIFIGKPLDGDDCTPVCKGIVHMGSVDHALIPSFLNAADVFVLPTLKEGCSNAVVEALACGLPVISSDRPFNDDILNNYNSIRIEPEDVNSIANAISRLKNDKDLYNHLKTYCMDHSAQYSIKIRARKIIDFINSKI